MSNVLHKACERGDLEEVKRIVESRRRKVERINAHAFSYFTPLHCACANGHYEVAKYLIDNGADLESSGEYDATPFMWAAAAGHLDICKLLFERGTNVYARNMYNENALVYAVRGRQYEVCKFLLERFPYLIMEKNYCGHTPVDFATKCKHDNDLPEKALIAKLMVEKQRIVPPLVGIC